MKVLNLVLKGKWYDMIESGVKKEEYRDLSDHWTSRLMVGEIRERNNHTALKEYIGFKHFDVVRFQHGYAKDARKMTVECLGIDICGGAEAWGAIPGTDYFVIKLGKILSKSADRL